MAKEFTWKICVTGAIGQIRRRALVNNRFKPRQPADWRLNCPCRTLLDFPFLDANWWEHTASHGNNQQPNVVDPYNWMWCVQEEASTSNDLCVCVSFSWMCDARFIIIISVSFERLSSFVWRIPFGFNSFDGPILCSCNKRAQAHILVGFFFIIHSK